MSEIELRPFVPADQAAVRALILAGLADHFGELDTSLNHDLDNIAANYVDQGAVVIVAELDGRIIGTGTLLAEAPGVGRLVRMSVSREARGQGLGKRLVRRLIEIARARGNHLLLVETNDDWHDAIALYHACGFQDDHVANGEAHFRLDLDSNAP
jgi:GNAT superfamily N-acetyltransferase